MKVIKGIISAILVVFIVLNLMLIGLFLQVRNFISEDGISAIVGTIDAGAIYDQMDPDTKEEIGSALEQMGIPKENIGAILETDAAKEIVSTVLGTYKDELFSGQPIEQLEIVSPEMIENVFAILESNEKELTYAMFGKADEETLNDYRNMIGELKEEVNANLDSLPQTIGDLTPEADSAQGQTGADDKNSESILFQIAGKNISGDELMKVLNILGGTLPITIIGVLTALLLLFILLMWRKRLNFLIWYAVPFLISAVFFIQFRVISSYKDTIVSELAIDDSLVPTFETLILSVAKTFRLYALILAGAGVLCIVLYALFHKKPEDDVPPRNYNTPQFVNDAQ